MPRETLTRLMTGIFIAQVAVKLASDIASDILLYNRSFRYWRENIIDALETTTIKDAFYMPAAIALMRHYQS